MFKVFLLCLYLFPLLETQKTYQILDLQNTNSDFASEASQWTPTIPIFAPLYSMCSDTYILGGYGKVSSGGNLFTRHYTGLEDHVSITVTYDAWIIDATSFNTGTLGYGNELIQNILTMTTYSLSANVGSLTTDLCGTSTLDLAPIQVSRTFLHAGKELYLRIGGSGIFGFRNVKVTLASQDLTASENCAYTTPNTILDIGYNCACAPGQVFVGTCQTCDASCLTCFDHTSTGCLLCNIGYYRNGLTCEPCSSSCTSCFGSGPSSCLSCPIGYLLNADFTCRNSLIDNFISIAKPAQTATSASMIATSVASAGTSATVRTSMNGQMIQYIKYLGINYPSDLATALQSLNQDYLNFGTTIDQPDSMKNKDDEYNDPPPVFSTYDDDVDPTFSVNFWSNFLVLVIITILLLASSCTEWIINRKTNNKNAKKYSRALRTIIQNLLLTYLYADAADIFFFSVLNFRTNNGSSGLNIINIIVSIVFISIIVALITMHFIILRRYHRLRKSLSDQKKKKEAFEDFEKKYKGTTILWQDFKENSFWTHSFLLIAIIRDIMFSLVLTLLYEYPLAQAIIIFLLSVIVLSYLLIFRPFEELKEALQACLCEVILFGVNICVLLLAISDKNESISSDGREGIGKAIMIMCLVFNFIPIVFLAINVALLIKEVVKWLRDRRRRHKVLPSPAISPTQDKNEEQKSLTSMSSPPSMIQPQLNDSQNLQNVRAALKDRIAKKIYKARENSDGFSLNVGHEENDSSQITIHKE